MIFTMEKMKSKLLVFVLFFICVGNVSAQKVTEKFRADLPQIRYVGRTLVSPAGEVSFDWVGTYWVTCFTGDYCAMRVSDTKKNYYNVWVDGNLSGVVSTSGKEQLVVLAKGLKKGTHTLRVQKRSEGEQGRTTLHGFELSKGNVFLKPERISERHIEFIGNSLTCGFGTEGKSKKEPFKPETENCDKAYACMIARYFNADYTLVAHSGQGAVRNWGDEKRASDYTMKERMMQTFDEDKTVKWDFSKSTYRPDLVVINLGSNDFATQPQPTYELFAAAYRRIVGQIREAYGEIPILCIAPRVEEPAYTYIKAFCDASGIPGIHFAAILPGIHNWDSDLGSNFHPNYTGQKKMAMALIPYVATITGWSLEDKVVK